MSVSVSRVLPILIINPCFHLPLLEPVPRLLRLRPLRRSRTEREQRSHLSCLECHVAGMLLSQNWDKSFLQGWRD